MLGSKVAFTISLVSTPDGTTARRHFQTCKRNKFTKKIATFMWYSNDMFHYMFKAKFVTLVSLKVSSGGYFPGTNLRFYICYARRFKSPVGWLFSRNKFAFLHFDCTRTH